MGRATENIFTGWLKPEILLKFLKFIKGFATWLEKRLPN